jgi:hypothetical protein
MAEDTTKIERVRCEAADNGYKLMWCEITEKAPIKGQSYANRDYVDHEEVFQDDELKDMLKRFEEMATKMRESKGGVDDEEEEEDED